MSIMIPGVLARHDPAGTRAPVVFDSPHSGNEYPDDFGHCLPFGRLRCGEDAFVDERFAEAPAGGATLLRALFPRTYIDPNRAPDDVDESLLDGSWPLPVKPGVKASLGIGLIPKRQPAGLVYDRKLSVDEAMARLDGYYRPYHRALEEALDRSVATFGAVWHVNCHSMPATSSEISPEGPGMARPHFCLGDRDGTTCEPAFTRFVADELRAMGYDVTVNEPYKGVELVRRYADPAAGRHSLQIEINRALYMDERTITRNEGFHSLRSRVAGLVRAVCAYASSRLAPAAAE